MGKKYLYIFILIISCSSFVRAEKDILTNYDKPYTKQDSTVVNEYIKYCFEDKALVPFAIYNSLDALELAKKIKYEKGINKIFDNLQSIINSQFLSVDCGLCTIDLRFILNSDVNVYMTLYDSLGYYYSNNGQQDKALECFQNVEILASKNDLRLTTYTILSMPKYDLQLSKSVLNGIAGCYKEIGKQYLNKEEYDISTEYENKALKIYKGLGNRLGFGICCKDIGTTYFYSGNNILALDYLLKSLRICEDLNYKSGFANCNMNIGAVYNKEEDYSKAIDYEQKALSLFEEIKDDAGILKCYNNFGNIYGNQGDQIKAIDYYKQALKLSEKIQDVENMIGILNNIGDAYIGLREYSKSLEYLNRALKLNKKNDYKILNLYLLNNIADANLKLKRYDEALEYALESTKLAKKLKELRVENDGYKILNDIYKLKSNYKKVLEYTDLYEITKDSLFNYIKNKKIVEIQYRYESEKKDKDIELLYKNNEINAIKIEKQKTFIRYMIAGLILLLFVILLILRNLKTLTQNRKLIEKLHEQERLQIKTDLDVKKAELERKKAEIEIKNKDIELKNKDIEIKNKNLEQFALRIVEKNEFIENIEKEVDALEGTEDDKKQLLNITNKIRQKIVHERKIFDIENKINESYSGFFEKLNKKHPNLTKTEIKICSLLLLNFDNTQIATWLNLTTGSLKRDRNRLRKKLSLNPEDDTISYLKTL